MVTIEVNEREHDLIVLGLERQLEADLARVALAIQEGRGLDSSRVEMNCAIDTQNLLGKVKGAKVESSFQLLRRKFSDPEIIPGLVVTPENING